MKYRRDRRRKQILDDLQETSGHWMLKKEEPVSTVRGTRFGEGHGIGLKHTTGRRR
jgi:hypothetical protein